MQGSQDYSHFFEVKLDLFDGPIDLLLHLVKQNELPLEKVSLAAVTDQYMRCVENARHFDLEVAGEYLVIAATLLSLKSGVLLNKPVEMVIDEEGNLVDPHEELLRKIREAAIFKESAEQLVNRNLLGVDVFAAPCSLDDVETGLPQLKPHDPMWLGKAFRKMLSKAKIDSALYTVAFEPTSIVERMMSVLKILEETSGPVSFEKLVPDMQSRSSLIASFVALLELCKRQVVALKQGDVFDEILVELAAGKEAHSMQGMGLSSEFDEDGEKKSVNA